MGISVLLSLLTESGKAMQHKGIRWSKSYSILSSSPFAPTKNKKPPSGGLLFLVFMQSGLVGPR